MAEEHYQRLQCLNASKTSWKIKVRVTRMWPVMNAERVFRGQNCLLVDIDGYHIQAFVYVDIWKNPNKKLEEGEIYIITNFTVKSAFGKLRPVSSKLAISFTNATEVVHVKKNDPLLVMNKYEFVELEDLKSLAIETCPDDPTYKDGEPEFAYDVIGVLEESEGFQMKKTKYGDRPQFKFKLSDGRCSHDVLIWGDLASSVKRIVDADDSEQKIIILASTKVVTWKGAVQIKSLPSTKVYLNIDDDATEIMKERLDEVGYVASQSISSIQEQFVQTQTERYTLNGLRNLKDIELIEKEVICRVKISKVNEEYKWYYDCCPDCGKEVNKIDSKFKCLLCPRSFPVPDKKFKVLTLVEDETATSNMILLDLPAKRIFNTTAKNLSRELRKKKAADTFPEELKTIVGKEFTFTILINEENILNNSDIFYASDLHQQVSNLHSESQSHDTINVDDGFNSQEGEATPSLSKNSGKMITETPGTGKSSSNSSAGNQTKKQKKV